MQPRKAAAESGRGRNMAGERWPMQVNGGEEGEHVNSSNFWDKEKEADN